MVWFIVIKRLSMIQLNANGDPPGLSTQLLGIRPSAYCIVGFMEKMLYTARITFGDIGVRSERQLSWSPNYST